MVPLAAFFGITLIRPWLRDSVQTPEDAQRELLSFHYQYPSLSNCMTCMSLQYLYVFPSNPTCLSFLNPAKLLLFCTQLNHGTVISLLL